MDVSAFIPFDRRRTLAMKKALANRTAGAALFADISGFTPLTKALATAHGPRRGADELTRHLNRVYTALIAGVHIQGGSVIGFSGDAITCWFDAEGSSVRDATHCALQAAAAVQTAMLHFASVRAGDATVALAVKTAIASGNARRFLVGDPDVQHIDVLAGATLDRMAAAEAVASSGETVLDEATAELLGGEIEIQEWRAVGDERFAVVTPMFDDRRPTTNTPAAPSHSTFPPQFTTHNSPLTIDYSSWVLPTLRPRFQIGHTDFLAELRPAVALFLRFKRFDYDADDAAGEKLDRYIRWVQGVLARHGGALIQLTTGDKGSYLYAAFGAPVTQGDDVRQSAAAALVLRAPPANFGITQTQIGVAMGRMRVGAYGSATRQTYGVLGNATNLAARLMGKAKAGQVLVSEAVAARLDATHRLESLGAIVLKGLTTTPVWSLTRARAATHGLHGLHEQPLVGREVELAVVDALLARAIESGRGKVLCIEGEAGVGKSHFAAVCIDHARERGFDVSIGACQSTSQQVPFIPVRQVARDLLGLPAAPPSDEDAAAQIERVREAVARINRDWLLRLPLLGDLLGLPIADNETTAAFDAQLRREALNALLVEMVQTRARRSFEEPLPGGPLLLVIEDAHWMDEASQAVALAIARVVGDAPVLLAFVQRPPLDASDVFAADLAAVEPQTRLTLGELSTQGVTALVQNRLGGRVDALALALIGARAQGNAFFTEELVDALVESGGVKRTPSQPPFSGGKGRRGVVHDVDSVEALSISHPFPSLLSLSEDEAEGTEVGVWALAPALIERLRHASCLDWDGLLRDDADLAAVDLGLPDSVHGLVLSRLDRLPEPTKLTLKVASVIGRTFEVDVLARAHPASPGAGAESSTLDAQLATLAERHFARLETAGPQVAYIFKHNITQEAVYKMLLHAQQQALHARVASALETLQPDAVERLAHHFHSSDLAQPSVRNKALHYLDAAGHKAQRDYANETALRYFDSALALDVRPSWLRAKVELLHLLGRRDSEAAALDALLKLESTGKSAAKSLVSTETLLLQSEYYEAVGEYEAAAAVLTRALDSCQRGGDLGNAARCLSRQATVAWRQGDYSSAHSLYAEALELTSVNASPDVQPRVEAEIRYGLGFVERQTGDYRAAREQFEHVLYLSRARRDQQTEAKALNALGALFCLQQKPEQGAVYFEQALTLRRAIGDRAGEGSSLLNLAQAEEMRGRYTRAEPLLRQALALQHSLRDPWWEGLVWNQMGVLQMETGQWRAAEESLRNSLRVAEKVGNQTGRLYTLGNLGQVQHERGQVEAALATLHEALLLAKEQGNAVAEAMVYVELARANFSMHEYKLAIRHASAGLEIREQKALTLPMTSALSILARAHLQAGNARAAADSLSALEALLMDDHMDGRASIELAHRDWYACYLVHSALGNEDKAFAALGSAYTLLNERAQRIADETLHNNFLQATAEHRAILQAMRDDTVYSAVYSVGN